MQFRRPYVSQDAIDGVRPPCRVLVISLADIRQPPRPMEGNRDSGRTDEVVPSAFGVIYNARVGGLDVGDRIREADNRPGSASVGPHRRLAAANDSQHACSRGHQDFTADAHRQSDFSFACP